MPGSQSTTSLIAPYGGALVDLLEPQASLGDLKRHAGTLPSLQISERSMCDLELLATGAFSPLDRFMTQAQHDGPLRNVGRKGVGRRGTQEDRGRRAETDCVELNGLAMIDGRPRFATALGETNQKEGWRDKKASGGVLIDIASSEIVSRGLSMPHSPRWGTSTIKLVSVVWPSSFGVLKPDWKKKTL